MSRSARTPVVAGTIALLALALMVPSAAAAAVVPATVPELPTSWAYGANTSTWVNVTNASGNYVGSIHSYFGFQVVLNQTNLSASDTLVELKRTIAFDYQAEYCTPTCTNPTGEINASYTAWQVAVGFVNFSTGTVTTGSGTSVPALAVDNAAVSVQGNLTERFATGYRNLFNTWKTGNDYLTVQAGGDLSIAFSPSFGLVPTNLSAATSWSSSSAYTAAGSWSASYAWAKNPIFGANTSGRLSPSGSLTSTGTVTLVGSEGPAVSLHGAVPTQSVVLVLGGPFALRDGILFLPTASDIFQSSADQSWSSYADAVGPASTAAVNFGARVAHLGLLASATTYQPVATSSFPTATAGPATSVVPAGSIPYQPSATPQTLQAQPEDVNYASQQSSCLAQGSCPGQAIGFPGEATKKNVLGAVVLVVAIAVVAALVAIGVVSRRRQVPPPPPRTNSALYPPANAGTPAPSVPPGATGPRTPPTGSPPNDPLGHLW